MQAGERLRVEESFSSASIESLDLKTGSDFAAKNQ